MLLRFVRNEEGQISDVSRVSTPPGPLLGEIGHNVRAKAIDFNADGWMDVLVFTRETWNGSQWPVNSRIQFLKNTGGGQFVDVTADVLVGYDSQSNASYHPVFIDLNGDGRVDVFLSESQYGASNSTALLIQGGNGQYVDTARTQLSALVNANGGMATVLRGPAASLYFAFETQYYGGVANLRLSKFTPR